MVTVNETNREPDGLFETLEATRELTIPELTSDPASGNIWIRSDL